MASLFTDRLTPEPPVAVKLSSPLASSWKAPYRPTPLVGLFRAPSRSPMVAPAGVCTFTVFKVEPSAPVRAKLIAWPAGKPLALELVRPVS